MVISTFVPFNDDSLTARTDRLHQSYTHGRRLQVRTAWVLREAVCWKCRRFVGPSDGGEVSAMEHIGVGCRCKLLVIVDH